MLSLNFLKDANLIVLLDFIEMMNLVVSIALKDAHNVYQQVLDNVHHVVQVIICTKVTVKKIVKKDILVKIMLFMEMYVNNVLNLVLFVLEH